MLVIAGCQQDGIGGFYPKAEAPIPERLVKVMKSKGMAKSSPIMIRIYKQESALEVWKAKDTGRYDLLETYEICKWSGRLGPKFKEGDRQAPEGFYTINPYQMNPNSDYHLSFNIGFPNAYDRALGRTGTHLMVHGACSSAGCYSMTDEKIEEIYTLAREAFKGGQTNFQVQAYPFRMSPENMATHKDSEHFEFWKMLKEGSDYFEITKVPPKVDICDKRYVFNRLADEKAKFKATESCPETTVPPSLAMAYAEKSSKDEKVFAEFLKKQAIRDAWAGKKDAGPTAAEPESSLASVAPASDESAAANSQPVEQVAEPAATASGDVVPVPAPNPRAQPQIVEEPKKKSFFSWLKPRRSQDQE
ncbi:MAG: L,D-transpeptidase family protein [Rhizobiaceae bacterium]